MPAMLYDESAWGGCLFRKGTVGCIYGYFVSRTSYLPLLVGEHQGYALSMIIQFYSV